MSRCWHTDFASFYLFIYLFFKLQFFALLHSLSVSPCDQPPLYLWQQISASRWTFLSLTSCQVQEASCPASHRTFQCSAPTGSRGKGVDHSGCSSTYSTRFCSCCIHSSAHVNTYKVYTVVPRNDSGYNLTTNEVHHGAPDTPPEPLLSQLLLNAHEHSPVSAVVAAAAPAVVFPSQTQQAAPGS